jgi:hypothetical protein
MDVKVATRDVLIAEIAGRQHGIVSKAQLRGVGVSEDAIRARESAGRLHRLHRGVYAVGHTALSLEGRLLAGVLAVGGGPRHEEASVLAYWGAAVSHRGAACLWRLLSVSGGPPDVVVSGDGGRAKRRDIWVHRSRSLEPRDVTLRQGIPVTTPARTIADLRLAITMRTRSAVPAWELRRAIRQANVLGLPIGEENSEDRTRSDLERDFLRLCRRHGVPPPEVNVRVGAYLVDFLWCERRLVVETDGYVYHGGREAFQDDRGRDLELRRLGYEVVRLSERQVNEESDRVAKTLAALLRGSG